MEPTYRVVFRGELLPGFELSSVKQAAEVRLKAPAGMVTQLFSGRRVILKKGISIEVGSRYLAELENLGMKAAVEEEASADAAIVDEKPAPTAAPAAPPAAPSVALAPHSEPVIPELTASLPHDLGAYAPPTEAAIFAPRGTPADATVFVPRNAPLDATESVRSTDTQKAFEVGAEPTIFVPRNAGSEPTMLVEPSAVNQRPSYAAPAEPTVFVPKTAETEQGLANATDSFASNRLPPAEATVFVPRPSINEIKRSFDSERTLIASAETLAEYFSATSPQRNQDEPSLLEDSGANAAKPEPTSTRNFRGSSDKTELAELPPAYRPGSNDTTVFVAPKRGSSEPTIMAPISGVDEIRRSLAEEAEEQEENQAANKRSSSRAVVLLVVVAAIAAAAYYYFMM